MIGMGYMKHVPECVLNTSTLQDYVPLWQKQCIDGGCSLTPCHFQPSALAQYPVVRITCSLHSLHVTFCET